MTPTFLQSFFHRAKEQGQSIAIRMATRHRQWFIPNWQLRSKAKHFALGLMHSGALPGERIFLSNHFHPHYIFSELGSLVAGLETLTLPSLLHPDILKSLLEKHQPTILYAGGSLPSGCQEVLRQWKRFKLIIDAPAFWGNDKRHCTFRKLFNSGIVHERSQIYNYRAIKEQRRLHDLMTPEKANPELPWSPLRFQSIEQAKSIFGTHLPQAKFNRLFVQIDLSRPAERLLGFYWPLAMAREVFWVPPEASPENFMQSYRPAVALLQRTTLERLAAEVELSPKKNWRLPWLKNRPWEKHVGKKLQLLWLPDSGSLAPLGSEKFPFRMELLPAPTPTKFLL